MRDRLIKFLGDFPIFHSTMKERWMPEAVERLADHLLAEGVIAPPCKVGDIVYALHWYWRTYTRTYINGDIMPYQITNIAITQNKNGVWTKKYRAMEVQNGKTIDWQLNFEFDAIGKTVFLTKEEAEKALAERSENGT